MQGSREYKVYLSRARAHLKARHFDDLAVFKWQRCKKWRKQNRRARDGSHGTPAQYPETKQ